MRINLITKGVELSSVWSSDADQFNHEGRFGVQMAYASERQTVLNSTTKHLFPFLNKGSDRLS